MASNRPNAADPKVAAPNAITQDGAKEKEDDMFVLISRRNPWKDGKLVSSLENPPTTSTKSADTGSNTKDKDGWETIPLFGSNPKPRLETELRNHAGRIFYRICEHFDTGVTDGDFSRPRLVRYTYTYSLSQESGDHFLRAFFKAVDLQISGDEDISFEDIRLKFFDFGDYLFNHFYLPVKASTKKTPQPSLALHSAVQEAQGRGRQQDVGTGPRLSILRRDCLIRDLHRCIISRRFDLAEAMKRRLDPGGSRDDEGNLIANDPFEPAQLEVAHILPHSLTRMNQGDELNVSKESTLSILDMFDVGVAELIQGPEIDRPRNALTLTHDFHQWFSDFQVYFEPVPDSDHTYTIRTHVAEEYFFRRPALPITCELYLTPERKIEPPSSRLLAIHCAISRILYLSGAGEYIDKIYRDMEEHGVQANGSTPLGHFVSLAISEQSSSACA
ncbi:hypothetical protein GQX73_g5726 [Xylaria multiplex]|uniref:HNH nuclease domain-containing protein n=1 Tax=Xylaria multiplex TaxID=323545 RepID=A0A7C8J083_9PEZI|nr:hypothetical protein GQX73_g5726 [Xylaria multiplex]